MVKRLMRCAVAIGAWLILAGDARAQIVNFTDTLNGAQENPPTATTAIGAGEFSLNAARTQLTYSVRYAGLSAASISGTHFHNGPAGVNAGVVRDVLATGPAGHPNGSFAGIWANTDAQALTPTLVTELLAGRIYFNIHTTPSFGGGEIRGQVFQVPEPASLALSGLALGGMLAYGRRRRTAQAG